MSWTVSFDLNQIRADRVLHEALTIGPDPLHLSLVFQLPHTAASRYARAAEKLLDDGLEPETVRDPGTGNAVGSR